jgi:hypothetical protein
MAGARCSACGGDELEPGFLEDSGEGSSGDVRWIRGPRELGFLGGTRRRGKQRYRVETYRCLNCSHLDLYIGALV